MRKALSIFLIFVIALSVYPIRIYASGVEDEGDKIQDADLESIDINAFSLGHFVKHEQVICHYGVGRKGVVVYYRGSFEPLY